MGYRNLAEVLSSIPGLYGIDQYYHEGIAFGIRGFWSNWTNKQLIILVDGIPQINPHRNNYILPHIAVPVEAIERIEVVRGPLSVIYGNGAFFGAINIITDKQRIAKANIAEEEGISSRVSAGIGNRGGKKLYGRMSGSNQNQDLHFTLTASHTHTDGIAADYDEMVAAGYMDALTQIGAGFSGAPNTTDKLENSEKYLSLNAHVKDFSFHFTHVQTKNESFIVFPGDLDGNHQTHTNNTLGLSYAAELTEALSLQARLSYRQTKLVSDYYPAAFLNRGARAAEEKRQGRTYEAEVTTTYKHDKTNIVTGLSYRTIPKVTSYLNISRAGLNAHHYEATDSINSSGLFVQLSYDFSERFKLVAGARLEHLANYTISTRALNDLSALDSTRKYDQGGTELIPRLAAIYRPSEQHSLKFLYSEAVSWPSFDQNQPQVINPSLEQLEMESIKALELVYDYTPSDQFGLEVSVFRNEMENLIVRSLLFDDVSRNVTEIQNNLGELSTTGIEATIRYQPTPQWNIELSGSYQHSKDKNNQADTSYSPQLLGYFKTAYRFGQGSLLPGLSIALDGQYTSSMQPAFNLDTNAASSYIGDKSDGYFNLGLNLRLEDSLLEGMFMNLRVSNLLDKQIRYPVFTNNDWATQGYIGEGRRILFSVGMDF